MKTKIFTFWDGPEGNTIEDAQGVINDWIEKQKAQVVDVSQSSYFKDNTTYLLFTILYKQVQS